MSWFFKVARGWAPYAAAQSERLEAGFRLFQTGTKEHVVLDDWRVDLERMIQYRADDPSRSRPVKREGPPAASAASSGQGPAKRQKLLLQLVEAKDDELFSDLSSEDLKKVADRLEKLQAGCQGRIKAAVPGKGTDEKAGCQGQIKAVPGKGTEEKDLVWTSCDFTTAHGAALHSPVLFSYARLHARVGSRPVLFQIRQANIVNAEAEYNAFKLSYLKDGREGDLIWPPAPYEWSADGEHDPEMRHWDIRSACGVQDDRPANKWFQAILGTLVSVAKQETEKRTDMNFETAFEEIEEWFDEYFDQLPDSVMTMAEYFAKKAAAEAPAMTSLDEVIRLGVAEAFDLWRSGACGLMALTETADGLLVFGQRSQYVGAFPGYFHCVPAGVVDAPDLLHTVQKELEEEVGVDWADVRRCDFYALLDTGAEQGHKYEFVLYLQLALPAGDVFRRYQSAIDKKEHEAFLFLQPGSKTARPEAPAGLPVVSVDDFLSGGYLVTDVARRALQLFNAAEECKT
ncbi:unnamed protein product [Symbiodinium necroappetens]|uniref:WWE domain-containing protein n=1 Tax=Symbiodinium necroappetens TaxID=1628268 RepID=A0A812N7E5_9DINO|nr:unnamed protein product [Symbiodinium necroappetens]